MNNKKTFWPLMSGIFVMAIAGFWGVAHWSSPEQIQSSRSTASLSSVELLKLSKNSKSPKTQDHLDKTEQLSELKRRPSAFKGWFDSGIQTHYEGKVYLISKDVFAMPEEAYRGSGKVLERRGRWVFFEKTNPTDRGYRVWLNSNNREVLVATGRMIVDVKAESSVQRLQDVYGLKIIYQAPGRTSYLLEGVASEDPISLSNELEKEQGVQRVELELIGQPVQPR